MTKQVRVVGLDEEIVHVGAGRPQDAAVDAAVVSIRFSHPLAAGTKFSSAHHDKDDGDQEEDDGRERADQHDEEGKRTWKKKVSKLNKSDFSRKKRR